MPPTDMPNERPRAQPAAQQTQWVDLQIKRAMALGDFDDLPGKGKPLGDLGPLDDRDWWLKKLIQREQIAGVLPEALQLRKDDRELDALLDAEHVERFVRQQVEDFNARIVAARRQLQGGPPVVTPTRDLETEMERWRERRRRRQAPSHPPPPSSGDGTARGKSRRRWFRR